MAMKMANFKLRVVTPDRIFYDGEASFLSVRTTSGDAVSYTHLDLKIAPQQQELVSNVIVDGNLIPGNLKQMGKDETWLKKEMEKQNMHNYSEILLGTLNSDNVFTAYPYQKDEFKQTLFV